MLQSNNYRLIIAVDPGFDYTKVVINGILFQVPYNVVDITGCESDYIGNRQEKFICSTVIENRSNLVGSDARKLLMEAKQKAVQDEKHTVLNSYQRFSTDDSRINILTCIGYAMIKYSEYTKEKKVLPILELDELNQWRIYVGMALPVGAIKDEWEYVRSYIVGHHTFDIGTCDGTYHLDFTIQKDKCKKQAQVVAALLGMIADDNGVPQDNPEVLNQLPALVIDGGYKTVGIFKLTRIQTIDSAESNEDFAMCCINERIAQRLATEYGRDDIKEYNIEDILEAGGDVAYLDKDKHRKNINIKSMREEEVKRSCEDMIEYLNKKFKDLLDINQIIFTGGTGASYFEYFMEYLKVYNESLAKNTKLTEYKFLGHAIEPVYGVAVGMYKSMAFIVKIAEEKMIE